MNTLSKCTLNGLALKCQQLVGEWHGFHYLCFFVDCFHLADKFAIGLEQKQQLEMELV